MTQTRDVSDGGGHDSSTRLRAEDLRVSYGSTHVLDGLDVEVPHGRLTVVVGPNACGKSTLLRALARVVRPTGGAVLLDRRRLEDYGAKELGRRLGMLPQSPTAPEGMSVGDLVARGRYPHQGLLRQWSARDQQAVDDALAGADVTDLAHRSVHELSGGQRQRVWLAMALAQETDLLLLDEPTTYLDIAHQVEVLEMTRRLVTGGRTVVAVLHELNLAFRYADHLLVMSQGVVVASGQPVEIVTPALIQDVYDLRCRVIDDPVSGTPLVVPDPVVP